MAIAWTRIEARRATAATRAEVSMRVRSNPDHRISRFVWQAFPDPRDPRGRKENRGLLSPRWDHTPSGGLRRMASFGANRRCWVHCILATLLSAGCLRPRAELRDSLEARVLPVADRPRPA